MPAESLTPSPLVLTEISALVVQQLQAAWNWLAVVLDCTEAQLRFGLSLSAATLKPQVVVQGLSMLIPHHSDAVVVMLQLPALLPPLR